MASVRPLAWIALVPFLIALRQVGTRAGVFVALAGGTLHAYSVGTWFANAITNYYDQSALFGVVFFFAMAALMVAPYYVIFGLAYQVLARSYRGWVLVWLAAAAWVACEFARGRLMTATPFFIGNPWALLGYSQVGFHPMTQIASVTGVYGVSFAIALVNVAVAELCLNVWHRRESMRAGAARLLAAGMPALAILAFGHWSLRSAPVLDSGMGTPVAVVQGNIANGVRWQSDMYGKNLETYLRLTLQSLREAEPAIVFWPEAAMTFFLADEPLYRASIARVLSARGTEIVAGGPFADPAVSERYFNSAFLIEPNGEILARYDKQYLVPFSEYFPFAGVDFLRRRFDRVRVFSHGGQAQLLPTVAGMAGVVVCNEAMLPSVVSRRVAEGASYLINPSNDSWVSDDQFATLQFDVVSLRSIEQRRYLVRSSTSGPSAIVDAWGRSTVATELGSRAVIHGRIVERSDRTLYSRVGDLFASSCLAAALVGLALPRFRG